jgi:mRNA interferase RelE/StbE
MRIRYTKQAIKYLLKLQAKKVAKIRETIKQIAGGDTEGLNIVYMKNLDVYRVRVGDFRVIYEIQDDELLLIVIKVGSRGDVYK